MSNLALWEQVQTPDPAYTKSFTRGGGFSGTAINATWLVKRATEVWGPMGLNWGITICEEKILEGAPFSLGDGQIAHEKIHCIRVDLWYPAGEQRGVVTQFGQTTFVGRNKHGCFTDEEAPKKSLTDAMTKALSLLGFAADVHMGKFDDNKYVNSAREKYVAEETDKVRQARVAELSEMFKSATTLDELAAAWGSLTGEEQKWMAGLKDARKATLTSAPMNGESSEKASSQRPRSARRSGSSEAGSVATAG
jgi:hypothetical protein